MPIIAVPNEEALLRPVARHRRSEVWRQIAFRRVLTYILFPDDDAARDAQFARLAQALTNHAARASVKVSSGPYSARRKRSVKARAQHVLAYEAALDKAAGSEDPHEVWKHLKAASKGAVHAADILQVMHASTLDGLEVSVNRAKSFLGGLPKYPCSISTVEKAWSEYKTVAHLTLALKLVVKSYDKDVWKAPLRDVVSDIDVWFSLSDYFAKFLNGYQPRHHNKERSDPILKPDASWRIPQEWIQLPEDWVESSILDFSHGFEICDSEFVQV